MDRSTQLGIADNYDAACAFARVKQAEWLRFWGQLGTCVDEGCVTEVRQSQRPDEQMLELMSFSTVEAPVINAPIFPNRLPHNSCSQGMGAPPFGDGSTRAAKAALPEPASGLRPCG